MDNDANVQKAKGNMNSDFTFAKDDTLKFLPWHIGTMVALAVFLLALVLSLGGWIGHHEGDYQSNFSVIIPGSIEKLDEKSDAVSALLSRQTGIESVHKLSDEALRSMLAPWLGSGDALSDTSLPIVLDVTLKKNADTDALAKALEKPISDIDPLIELDVKNAWADVFGAFVRILQGLAIFLVVVILAAMSLMIIFSARASLHQHKRTVNLLHAIGAEDGYIARQFQFEHFKIGLKGAVAGTLVASACYFILDMSVASLKAPVLPHFEFATAHIILVLVMPVFCAMIALLATRYSVLHQLKQAL